MTVADVREAMAETLRGIDRLNADAYIASRIRAPHAMIDYRVTYDYTMGRGSNLYQFVVVVYAQADSSFAAQSYLDTLKDPTHDNSVKLALEDEDSPLAPLVSYAHVIDASPVESVIIGSPGVEFLKTEFTVEVPIQ